MFTLIAVATLEGAFMYEYTTQGERIGVFGNQKSSPRSFVEGLLHLSDDKLSSVDANDVRLTWRATTGVILCQLKVSETGCTAITKDGRVCVGGKNGYRKGRG